MLSLVPCKAVCAVEFRAGAEEHIVCILLVQYTIQAILGRGHYRSRRQAVNLVGIVWRVCLQMLLEYPCYCKISRSIDYRRVSSKFPSFLEAVMVNACNSRILRNMITFTINYGSQDGNVFLAQSEFLGLLFPFLSPEFVIFLFHPLYEILRGYGPVELVTLRNDKAQDVGGIHSQGLEVIVIGEHLHKL